MNFKSKNTARNRARTLTALGLSMALSLSLLTGCGASAVSSATESAANLSAAADTESTLLSAQTGTASAEKLDASAAFSKRDLFGDWDESAAETITLNGSTATSTSKNVTVDGSTVTITGEGVYVLTGSLNGQVVVDADGDKVQLVLNNATITNDSSAAIYVKQADKVFVTLAEGTENRLSTTGDFAQSDDNKVDAVIFSKDDLTLNGSGSLTVTTEHGHGIVSKDELTLAGVTLTVNASGHALSGKDCICVASGTYTLTAGKDGLHSENTEDTPRAISSLRTAALPSTLRATVWMPPTPCSWTAAPWTSPPEAAAPTRSRSIRSSSVTAARISSSPRSSPPSSPLHRPRRTPSPRATAPRA